MEVFDLQSRRKGESKEGGGGRERLHKRANKNYVAERLRGWLKPTYARKFKVKAEGFSFNRYIVLRLSS